ncbi:MAG TPA: TetR/AcrR family transcriptional regulator [Candidatus Eubacterium faecipullorum]|uniref:TetR/AcrR family transcriptional regulator n=1 Tax=Candidatus Eubacterium faecipullorum TaxID=2838571 RepID=A0A9D1UG60_9FIRM|nr:TetR/AcrR family transcriptional regulator [Candidatus Eubacterium faecipullorum]
MKRAEKNKKSTSEIINAALKLYAKTGSFDISVNELCRENNISKGKFYHYFASKDDLFKVAASYVIDDMCEDIDRFPVSKSASLEENLKNYYAARIDYWLKHTDYFMLAYMLLSGNDYDFRRQFSPLRAKFDASLNSKTLEIIYSANVVKSISDNEMLEVMKLIYDNMFLTNMHKIITATLKGDTAHAQKLSDDLLDLYTRLIHVLLYGMLREGSK